MLSSTPTLALPPQGGGNCIIDPSTYSTRELALPPQRGGSCISFPLDGGRTGWGCKLGRRGAFFLELLALSIAPGYAIDEGVAKGSLKVEGRAVTLTHSYAHRHDNEEGLLDGPELRILLADREVPHTLLAGVYTARLDALARKGGVQGVLLMVDPRKLTAGMRGVLLMAEKSRGKSLTSFSFSGGDGGFRRLQIGNNRVLGDAHHESTRSKPAFEYSATFSAPLFREEPISEKLPGARAMDSEPFQAFAAYTKALGAGDLDAARRFATPESFREIDEMIAQAGRPTVLRMLRETSVVPGAKDKPQVFVRGKRALVVFQAGKSRGVQSLVQVDGKWLVD